MHKLLCGIAPPAKPQPNYNYHQQTSHPPYYGVLFPASEDVPRWVMYVGNYVPGTGYRRDGEGWFPNPVHPAVQLLGNLTTPLTITANGLRSRSRAGNMLELYSIRDGPSPGVPVNRSVLTVTKQRPAQAWFGPLLALKVAVPITSNETGMPVPPGRDAPQYLDMDMRDFRDIVDLLCTHPAVDINNTSITPAPGANREVSGVRINCPGDQGLGRPRFERINVRADSDACFARVSPISQLIQLPLRVSRCLPPHDTGFDAPTHELRNVAATDLMMGVDPGGAWGFAGLEWVDPAGSVLVVRADGQSLHPQVLQALCHWCVYVLRPLVTEAAGGGREGECLSKETVRSRVTKREWECFYEGFDAWMGNSWVKGVWPV